MNPLVSVHSISVRSKRHTHRRVRYSLNTATIELPAQTRKTDFQISTPQRVSVITTGAEPSEKPRPLPRQHHTYTRVGRPLPFTREFFTNSLRVGSFEVPVKPAKDSSFVSQPQRAPPQLVRQVVLPVKGMPKELVLRKPAVSLPPLNQAPDLELAPLTSHRQRTTIFSKLASGESPHDSLD